MSLEKIIGDTTVKRMTGLKRAVLCGDWHVPFQDDKAMGIMFSYMKQYKPHSIVLNGDLLDFYSISKFDHNPARKENVQEEIDNLNEILDQLRAQHPRSDIFYLVGNHESRLHKFIWANSELYGIRALELPNLLELDRRRIKYVHADHDYWKTDNGHVLLGDTLIMHGDGRLNGSVYSKYSGYSARGTMDAMVSSVSINHTHRGGVVFHTTPAGVLVGVENGCLCQPTGTANWQQGFTTMEYSRNKSYNHRFHRVEGGKLVEDGKVYG